MTPKTSGTGAVFNWDDADMDVGAHAAAAREQQWIESSDAIQARRMHEATSGDQARDNFRMTEQAYRKATDEGALVRPGDQLWKMAGYNKVAFGRLMKGMGLDDPNLVQVGSRVKFDWDVSAGEATSAANRFFAADALAKAARTNTSALNGISSSNIGNVEFGSGPAMPGSFVDVMGPPLTSRDRVMGTVNMANNIASQDLTREQLLGALRDVKSAFRDATTNDEQLWLRGAALSLHEAGASRGLLKPGETVGSPEFFGTATASMGFGGSNGAVPSGISPASGYTGPSFRSGFRAFNAPEELEDWSHLTLSERHLLGRLSVPKATGNSLYVGNRAELAADVAEIRTGLAVRDGDKFTTSSGRTWGMHETSIHPIEGPDVVNVTSQEYKVLVLAQKQGVDAALENLGHLERRNILNTEQVQRTKGLIDMIGRRKNGD